jgi:hypothetical protein
VVLRRAYIQGLGAERGSDVRTVGLLIIGVTLAGCAGTRQERAAEFQHELPQLVADCNEWMQVGPRLDGPTIRHEGYKACRRLAGKKSLGLADPAAASAYMRTLNAGANSILNSGASLTTAVPMPLPQVQ